MQAWYARGGFIFDCRDLRFEGRASAGEPIEAVVALDGIPFTTIEAYDRAHFPAPRSEFLQQWLAQPGTHARAVLREGQVAGLGVLRPCRTGYKFGPLFADDVDVARDLFHSLCGLVPGELVYLDVPENNPEAVRLAREEGMLEVFGCAKMYFGPAPSLPRQEIFGVTTFELG
jgi:hypothetical protein